MAAWVFPQQAGAPAVFGAAGTPSCLPLLRGTPGLSGPAPADHGCGTGAWRALLAAAVAAGLPEARRLSAVRRRGAAALLGRRLRSVTCCAEGPSEASRQKLGIALREAVKAEAEGEGLADLVRAETKANEVVSLFANGFSNFGNVEQAEKKAWTEIDLKEAGVESVKELLEVEDSVRGARFNVLAAIIFLGVVVIVLLNPSALAVNLFGGSIIAGAAIDTLVNNGAFQSLVLESVAGSNSEYKNRVVQHEAARFLVGYLIGVLPKSYSLSTEDALDKYESTRIKTGVAFCAAQFQQELEAGKVTSKTIDQFLCVKLAGIAQEYLMFGKAKTGGTNLASVEDLLGAVSLNPRQRAEITRWALYNVIQLLTRYKDVHSELAKAMSRGAPPEECMVLIERQL